MQYIFLRGIVDNTLANYFCPQCQIKALDQNVFITGISDIGIDISIRCQKCQTSTLLHAEMNNIPQNTIPFHLKEQEISLGIKDEDIVKLSKDIKNAHSVSDILGKTE